VAGEPEIAEEIVQDVFVRVWRWAAGFRGAAQVKSWLFRLAHNAVYHWRHDRQSLPTESLIDQDDIARGGVGLEDAIILRLDLQAALDGLSAKHREVLDLALVQGFALGEIALILDVPAGTVKSRLSYARRALSRQLSPIAEE
jgi:RNA polymerase sigma-70 factor (ECF subfamily)